MIKQLDIKQRSSICNLLCESLIGCAWLGSSRRVIMHHNELCREQLQRTLNNQTMINNRSLHTALTHSQALNQTI